MLWGERGIKGLDPIRLNVRREATFVHQRERAKSTDVAVVKSPGVRETERNGRVAQLLGGKAASIIDQQGAGEPRLHHDPIASRQVEHDQLGAPPGSFDRRSDRASPEPSRVDFAEDVRVTDLDPFDDRSADGAVEVPRDRLGLR